MEPIDASVILHVEIWNERDMWNHARTVFEQENGIADQACFEHICGTEDRPDIPACLQMIFDPGKSPPGVQIEDCSAEIIPPP